MLQINILNSAVLQMKPLVRRKQEVSERRFSSVPFDAEMRTVLITQARPSLT